MAVGDERTHAVRLGESQRLPIVSLATHGIESVGMGSYVAEKVQSLGREPALTWRGFDCAIAEAQGLVESAEQ